MTEYKPYKYGLEEFEYIPTICQQCNKLLSHTFVRKGQMQPEIMFHVYCDVCYQRMQITPK